MYKRMQHALTLAMVFSLLSVSVSHATPPFMKKFEELYPTFPMPEKGKCFLCHVAGMPKKVNNEYGKALETSGLNKQMAEDLKDPAKIDKTLKDIEDAFKKAEKLKNSQGEEFGQRIKDGKLPGG
jgi:hypothetical protein